MKPYSYLFIAIALASCTSSAEQFKPSELIRVSCSSKDGGKTCFGYGEIYSDGTSDACGRVPDGPEFAFKMTYEITGNRLCETVVKTSDPQNMPVGAELCGVYLERKSNELTYRFTDDPPTKLRHSYNAARADKWCQHLINAL